MVSFIMAGKADAYKHYAAAAWRCQVKLRLIILLRPYVGRGRHGILQDAAMHLQLAHDCQQQHDKPAAAL